MRRANLTFALLAMSISLLTAWTLIEPHPGNLTSNTNMTTRDSSKDERDILPDILSLNSNPRNAPPGKFRTGHVTETTLNNYLEKTDYGYVVKLPAPTNVPTPAIVDGRVYVSGGFGSKQYYSFDAFTGRLRWAVSLDDDGPSSPAIQDSVIVFNTESCTIFACDLITGRQLWSYWLGDPLMSMPTIADGIVFTSYPASFSNNNNHTSITPSHVLIAIELRSGKILWQKWIDSDVMSAPVAKDNLLYVTTFSGALYKVKQKTGEIIEAKAIRATSAPVFSNVNDVIISQRGDNKSDKDLSEVVVVGYGAAKKEVYKKKAEYLDRKVQTNSKLKTASTHMDAGNGFAGGAPSSANWKAAEMNIGQSNVSSLQSFQGSRSIYKNGKMYNTMGDEVVCLDSAGKIKWSHKLGGDMKNEGGFMGTPPIYVNGFIIVATLTGDVKIFDEKDGKVIKGYDVKDPIRYQPVADKGWIFLTSVNGRMHAIDTGNPLITGWNMWGGNAARTNESSHLN